MRGPYDDIINLPHHVSDKRPQMSMQDRAAQFSPFAALTGYDSAIHETARLTESKIELTEETMSLLNMKLQAVKDSITEQPEILFTYFKPDEKKSGGAYVTVSGTVKKMDDYERLVVLQSGITIPIDDLLDIEGEIFSALQY
ncbi:MAG: hypothetical protein HP061_00015 [Christensenellaceae bacterium]|nr:hypothetical protein [Christensenellaceae bacterium]